jgi:hypothetical protein
MQSSLKPKPADDPHDCVVIPPDAVRVAPSDAAPSDDEISNLLRAAARQHSDAQTGANPDQESAVPPLDASFRPSAVNDDFAPGRRRVTRAIAAIVLAACIGGAAVAWQASGYAVKKLVGKWIPQFALTGSLALDKLGLTATSAPPPGGPAGADAAPAAPAPNAPPASDQGTAAQETATPAQAAAESTASNTEPSDSAPLLQSMARDLANARKEVEALKTSVAELKASQQQMARELAKASEQSAHAKLTPPPARPAVTNARKPAAAYVPPAYSPTPAASAPPYRSSPAYSTTQAAAPPPLPPTAQPYVPRQVEPLPPPQAEGVPRPPMPVQQP